MSEAKQETRKSTKVLEVLMQAYEKSKNVDDFIEGVEYAASGVVRLANAKADEIKLSNELQNAQAKKTELDKKRAELEAILKTAEEQKPKSALEAATETAQKELIEAIKGEITRKKAVVESAEQKEVQELMQKLSESTFEAKKASKELLAVAEKAQEERDIQEQNNDEVLSSSFEQVSSAKESIGWLLVSSTKRLLVQSMGLILAGTKAVASRLITKNKELYDGLEDPKKTRQKLLTAAAKAEEKRKKLIREIKAVQAKEKNPMRSKELCNNANQALKELNEALQSCAVKVSSARDDAKESIVWLLVSSTKRLLVQSMELMIAGTKAVASRLITNEAPKESSEASKSFAEEVSSTKELLVQSMGQVIAGTKAVASRLIANEAPKESIEVPKPSAAEVSSTKELLLQSMRLMSVGTKAVASRLIAALVTEEELAEKELIKVQAELEELEMQALESKKQAFKIAYEASSKEKRAKQELEKTTKELAIVEEKITKTQQGLDLAKQQTVDFQVPIETKKILQDTFSVMQERFGSEKVTNEALEAAMQEPGFSEKIAKAIWCFLSFFSSYCEASYNDINQRQKLSNLTSESGSFTELVHKQKISADVSGPAIAATA